MTAHLHADVSVARPRRPVTRLTEAAVSAPQHEDAAMAVVAAARQALSGLVSDDPRSYVTNARQSPGE